MIDRSAKRTALLGSCEHLVRARPHGANRSDRYARVPVSEYELLKGANNDEN